MPVRSGWRTSGCRSRPMRPSASRCLQICSRCKTAFSSRRSNSDEQLRRTSRRVTLPRGMTRHVTWDKGISLVGHDLWLDPLTVRDLAFVSHAHTDHTRRHRTALMTGATHDLLPVERRPRGLRVVHPGQTCHVGDAALTVLDAGHMLGSAQLLFEHDGSRLLYTGDVRLRHGAGRPHTAVPRADVLVIESTYGRPHFRFPDPDSAAEQVARWCRRTLDARVTPVLLAHALGKAQEVMLALAPY